jgi:hypothetical protein
MWDPAYDDLGPQTTRNDTRYFATTWIDLALGAQWSVRGTVRLLRTDSNIPDINSTEWIFIGGLSWTGAVL